MSEELRRRLKAVDPNLKIIPARPPHNHKLSKIEWDASTGVVCSSCGKEVFKSKDGLCMPCWEAREDAKVEIVDKAHVLGFLPESVIMRIARKSGK